MNYKFDGQYERQDAINVEIIGIMHNFWQMGALLLYLAIIFGVTFKITYEPSIEFVVMASFALLVMYPAAIYLALAIHAELGYKKYPLRDIDATVDEKQITMKTNLYQREYLFRDVKRIIETRKYVLVFVSRNGKEGLLLFKRDWLRDGSAWGMFKTFMCEIGERVKN